MVNIGFNMLRLRSGCRWTVLWQLVPNLPALYSSCPSFRIPTQALSIDAKDCRSRGFFASWLPLCQYSTSRYNTSQMRHSSHASLRSPCTNGRPG